MRARRRGIVSIALASLVAVAVVASLPAANRDAAATFESFPGPAEVTFGEDVSYRASLANGSGSTFTQIRLRMTRPCVSDGPALAPVCKNFGTASAPEYRYATLVYSSCEDEPASPPAVTGAEYSCPAFPNLPAGTPASESPKVTLVWRTPALSATATCPGCFLFTVGTWTIKESNNTTPSTDTHSFAVRNTLLVQPDPTKSGGYALGTVKPIDCTTATANVLTNQSVGQSNKIATAVCAGTLPGTELDPGVAVEITESAPTGTSGPGFTDVVKICIPDVGFSCPLASETNAWQFDPVLATLIFKIAETSDWPKGERLETAYHNGDPYTEYTCTFDRDGRTKIWTVVCPADSNGDWRFG